MKPNYYRPANLAGRIVAPNQEMSPSTIDANTALLLNLTGSLYYGTDRFTFPDSNFQDGTSCLISNDTRQNYPGAAHTFNPVSLVGISYGQVNTPTTNGNQVFNSTVWAMNHYIADYENNVTSNSYSMHMGSAKYNVTAYGYVAYL